MAEVAPVTRRAIWLVALLVIAPGVHASLQEERVVLQTGGELLAGTLVVAIGDVDDGDPVPEAGLAPVSHASHAFHVPDCPSWLTVEFSYASITRAAGPAPVLGEEASMRLEIRTPDGQRVTEPWLATNGTGNHVTGELGPGPFEFHVIHLLGGPVEYNATITATSPQVCTTS